MDEQPDPQTPANPWGVAPTRQWGAPPPAPGSMHDFSQAPSPSHVRPQQPAGARLPPSPARPAPTANWSKVGLGLLFIVIGLGVTIVTYSNASSSPTGGHYFIAFGPVIAGIGLVVKELTGS